MDVTNYCDWNSKNKSIKGIDVANALIKIGKNKGFENTADWLGGIKKGKVIACVSGIWDEAAIKKMYGKNYAAANFLHTIVTERKFRCRHILVSKCLA